jgi:DNA-binding response OmpR family regulator
MTKHKILIADDDPALLGSLAIRLRATGYEVICAQDGYQTVSAAKRECPDLILLDVNMPAGDGFTVHQRLGELEETAFTPVVYLTGSRSEDLSDTVFRMGASALVHKPFDTGELLDVIAEALERTPADEDQDARPPLVWSVS